MHEAVLWVAAGIGFVALTLGNRTAAPLLASFVLSTALCAFGYFNIAVWLLIDALVIGTIVARRMSRADWIIVVLFPAAWVSYFIETYMSTVTGLVVVIQFLLTPPYTALRERFRYASRDVATHDDFDLRVAI